MKKPLWELIIILLFAAIVRFGGLNWCLPYNPHPDEWNMVRAITQLTWEEKLNPHFFAYGQFPLYLTYFSAKLYNQTPWINLSQIDTQEAIFFLRFWSAVAGIGTVFLVYLISKRFLAVNCSLLATTLAVFTPGLIQISHFGTTESVLSFFFLLILLFSFLILENPRLAARQAKLKYYIFSGIIFGLAVGTKISALIFGFPVFLVFILQLLKKRTQIRNIGIHFLKNLSFLFFTALLTFISSPYLVLAFKDSRGILLYEASVATGKSAVFYTRQFINTTPVIFQLKKIFPYALGWPIFILGAAGLVFSILVLLRKSKNLPPITNYQLLITVLAFLSYFLSQAFLFTKWTRFMAPIFAFFPIFAAFFIQKIVYVLRSKPLITNCSLLITFIAILPGLFFSSIYFLPDIRFTASDWIYKNIPAESLILFDTGNVVDIPINSPKTPKPLKAPNYQLISFDFYHLDENPELFPKLVNYLEESNYIIVPSRRSFMNHMRFPDKYPLTSRYYELLFSGKLGFSEIKIFHPFPTFQISNFKFQIDDERSEETFTVFDHPTIRIYKKIKQLTKEDYNSLFKNETI
ncbi:hypothetical protein COT64_01070 [Candidatus Shapirobacteria bacterium CG09_land_8_20_14_0_10_39_12]|uniref:ArnT-like N-terminal domain-containing protein n=1 Tax=Candidatus Shapirobacteria bacterium CG09_land_8_20_14_0_10_39_12 TaxID=1974885 RepID=A0A2H0WPZ5_9BACT|nr:MAG: hypothetical protein COT64_01070 [Candidatus Shapirobacteria bacterium CG09_land_8_20_14_0_10_39_12]